MQNIFIKTSVILLVMLITITSCKKDNLQQAESTDNNTAYANMIVNRIDNFRTRMHSTERDGDMILLDTAIWSLEALINYDKAYPDSAFKNFKITKSHYTLTVDENNMVTEAEVQQMYNLMLDTLNYQLSLLNDDVKFTVFSDVQYEVEGNTAHLTVINGYGAGFILGLYPPFNDDWIWGTLDNPPQPPYTGNCTQTDFTSDGSIEIEYRLNHPAAMPYSVRYTDIEIQGMTGWDFDDENGDPMLYVGTDINHCMTIDELTNNLVNADYLIKHAHPEGIKPDGKSFISVIIFNTVIVGNNTYLHYYSVTYGIPHFYQEQ